MCLELFLNMNVLCLCYTVSYYVYSCCQNAIGKLSDKQRKHSVDTFKPSLKPNIYSWLRFAQQLLETNPLVMCSMFSLSPPGCSFFAVNEL